MTIPAQQNSFPDLFLDCFLAIERAHPMSDDNMVILQVFRAPALRTDPFSLKTVSKLSKLASSFLKILFPIFFHKYNKQIEFGVSPMLISPMQS